MIEKLVKIISKSLPLKQAHKEAIWITQELPQNKWISACHARSKLVPLQYILGSQPFGKLDISCKAEVLIPRLDTEEWVMEASELLRETKIDNIVDYCTGSGCIGLGFASELLDISRVDCIDYKDEAVSLAKENLMKNSSYIPFPVGIYKGNVFEKFLPHDLKYLNENSHNILVSNPPYIPEEDMCASKVEESVLKYEPKDALVGDFEFYDALCSNVLNNYKSFKAFIFELGYISQAEKVAQLLNHEDWTIGIRKDRGGNLRNVIGWRHKSSFDVLDKMIHSHL